jgi:hypothetical protein
MRVADQIWPPLAAGTAGAAAGAGSFFAPQAFPVPDLAGPAPAAGAEGNDGGDGAGRRGAAGSKGVRSSSSKWRPMREGLVRKEGIAAAAVAAEEAAGVRGRADAAEEGDGAAVGRSGGRAELRERERLVSESGVRRQRG